MFCAQNENRSYPIHVCCLVQFPSDLVSIFSQRILSLHTSRVIRACDAQRGVLQRRNAPTSRVALATLCPHDDTEERLIIDNDGMRAARSTVPQDEERTTGLAIARLGPAKVDGCTVTFMGRLSHTVVGHATSRCGPHQAADQPQFQFSPGLCKIAGATCGGGGERKIFLFAGRLIPEAGSPLRTFHSVKDGILNANYCLSMSCMYNRSSTMRDFSHNNCWFIEKIKKSETFETCVKMFRRFNLRYTIGINIYTCILHNCIPHIAYT